MRQPGFEMWDFGEFTCPELLLYKKTSPGNGLFWTAVRYG
jgi:hypothetical protein